VLGRGLVPRLSIGTSQLSILPSCSLPVSDRGEVNGEVAASDAAGSRGLILLNSLCAECRCRLQRRLARDAPADAFAVAKKRPPNRGFDDIVDVTSHRSPSRRTSNSTQTGAIRSHASRRSGEPWAADTAAGSGPRGDISLHIDTITVDNNLSAATASEPTSRRTSVQEQWKGDLP
jgi:hypothetical protein